MLRLVNQTCPQGFSAGGVGSEGGCGGGCSVRAYVCLCLCLCVHACKHAHVFYFLDFHSHIICGGIIQLFHSSSLHLFIILCLPPVQTFYCINLLKHLPTFSAVTRASLHQSTLLFFFFFFLIQVFIYWTLPLFFSNFPISFFFFFFIFDSIISRWRGSTRGKRSQSECSLSKHLIHRNLLFLRSGTPAPLWWVVYFLPSCSEPQEFKSIS